MHQTVKEQIQLGKAVLGIELGSTRIKAVLIDTSNTPIASGAHEWENRYENGVWTYALSDVWDGIRQAYAKLCAEVYEAYGVRITTLASIGFSAMMHGYLLFDKEGAQLAPFRTWRNTMTQQAAEALTAALDFNIPQRWSVAHLYQSILNGEPHVSQAAFLTTLAGYVHWQLTGEKVLGIGDASGMFPIDSLCKDYSSEKAAQFDALISGKGYAWTLREILPKVLTAGQSAGTLTERGAKLLDGSGTLRAGIPLCPPEGDAGTGMVATNSVAVRTGNISAGTSVFAMAVLEHPLTRAYPEIDMVTTPTGMPVAMAHCNNCTSDLDAWVKLFKELNALTGAQISTPQLYDALYAKALEGDADCGGVLSYNYYSGEPVTGFSEGRPLLVRTPDSRFHLANFMRAQLFAAMGTLKIGMDILFEQEHVSLDRLYGHGGLFKTKLVGQRLMAAAMHTPVAVMDTAGEGGAWGIALLAAYLVNGQGQPLEEYLEQKVFNGNAGTEIAPDPAEIQGFEAYMKRYKAGLAVEAAAIAALPENRLSADT